MSKENESLMSANAILNDKLKSFEALLSADSFKLLKIMFKEMNGCMNDLVTLVHILSDIFAGKQIDYCELLGPANRKDSK
jgi:hypothetical protein